MIVRTVRIALALILREGQPVGRAEGEIRAGRSCKDKNEEQGQNHLPVVKSILPKPFHIREAASGPNLPY